MKKPAPALFAIIAAGVLLLSVPASAGKKSSSAITKSKADASVKAFVEGLNSLNEKEALSNVSAGDRMALNGKEDLLSLISERKLINPAVTAMTPVKEGKRIIGAQVTVKVEEIDPLDATKVPKEYTWFLVNEGGTLKVSVLSLWLAKRTTDE